MSEELINKLEQKISKDALKSIRLLIESVQSVGKYNKEVLSFFLAFDEELKNILDEKLFNSINQIYAEELKIAKDRFKKNTGKEIIFTSTDKQVLQAIFTADFSKIENYINYLGTDLKSALVRSLYSGIPIDKEVLLEKFDSKITRNIITEIRTGSMALSREVTLLKTEEYFEDDEIVFLYEGSDDDVTRPFCKELIGKILTKDEIGKLDNGQGLDPFIYGGGYNCRHEWIPLPVSIAKKDYGYGG